MGYIVSLSQLELHNESLSFPSFPSFLPFFPLCLFLSLPPFFVPLVFMMVLLFSPGYPQTRWLRELHRLEVIDKAVHDLSALLVLTQFLLWTELVKVDSVEAARGKRPLAVLLGFIAISLFQLHSNYFYVSKVAFYL